MAQSSLSHPIIFPSDTRSHTQYLGSFGFPGDASAVPGDAFGAFVSASNP
jgi:hypothetical protein